MRKTTVFGIFERDGKVYTQIVDNCSKAMLQGIIQERVDKETVINSDGWPSYDGFVELGFGHVRGNHAKDEFARNGVHINDIDVFFWGGAKVKLTKFKGIPAHIFHLHLKKPSGDTIIVMLIKKNSTTIS